MFTANEARELSGPIAEEFIQSIEKRIKEAAAKGDREVVIRTKPFCDWLYKESDLKGETKKAVKMLRDAGYTVQLYYSEGQFVDIGLWIRW